MKHINPIKHTTAENYEHFLSYMYGAGARHNALLCQAYFDGSDAPHEEYEAYMAAHPEPVKQEPAHPDDEAVDLFAAAMKAKLAKKRAEGRGGWEDKNQCSAEFLNRLLNEHVGKGDPVDVGNLVMMLWNRGERTEVVRAQGHGLFSREFLVNQILGSLQIRMEVTNVVDATKAAEHIVDTYMTPKFYPGQAEQEPFDMNDHPPHRLCECRKCMEYFTPLPDCDAFAASGKPIAERSHALRGTIHKGE